MGDGTITRERILAEALEAFARHGYEGARMEKIASHVGINKASLYFYFKSKEELFRQLFAGIIAKYHGDLRHMLAKCTGEPTEKRLVELYRDYVKYNWNNTEMDFWNRIYYFPPETMKAEIYQTTDTIGDEFMKELAAIFQEGIHRGEIRPLDPQRMAKTYYYILTCITLSVDIMTEQEGLRDMDDCFAVFWEGIRR